MKYFTFLAIIILLALNSCSVIQQKHYVMNNDLYRGSNNQEYNVLNFKDAVPNAETAVTIAEAILLTIYGEQILEQRPFNCELVKDSIWVLEGFFPTAKHGGPVMAGGVAYIEIQKRDSKVLIVTHGK